MSAFEGKSDVGQEPQSRQLLTHRGYRRSDQATHYAFISSCYIALEHTGRKMAGFREGTHEARLAME